MIKKRMNQRNQQSDSNSYQSLNGIEREKQPETQKNSLLNIPPFPAKPDKNPDPTKPRPGGNEPEKNDPTRIEEPLNPDPTHIDEPLPSIPEPPIKKN